MRSRPHRLHHAGRAAHAAAHVLHVLAGEPVAHDGLAVAARSHLAHAVVAQQDAQAAGERQRLHQLGVLAGAAPGREREQDAGRDGHVLVLHAVAAAVHVRVLVGVGGRQHALPGPHLLVELPPDHQHRVQPQVLAERPRAHAGAAQQHRGVQRATGAHHRARPHRDLVSVGSARLDAGGPAAVRGHALGARLHQHPRAGLVRVLEPGLERGLLGAELAAVVAEAADLLGAAAHVALHHLPLPAELVEPGADRLVAPAGHAVLGVHADALPDRVEALVELGARHRTHAVLAGPLLAHAVRGAERVGVVHERGAAQALRGQQAHAAVGARHAAAVEVEPVEARQLGAVEVLLGEVAARLHHQHVEARLREHGRGGTAARARAHHHHVAVERGGAAQLAAARSPAAEVRRAARAGPDSRWRPRPGCGRRCRRPCRSRRAARPCAAPGRRRGAGPSGCRPRRAARARARPAPAS